ncbi:MAG TPA: sorbosone dehydrogenase family protein, partial [Armatimonadota bacterium]|nr:sorbosone dehydrogenase family protein [Armatimonadota bacterium]
MIRLSLRAATAFLAVATFASCQTPMGRISLPDGFRIAPYATRVPGARSMALGPEGTLFVGSRREGTVYAITDRDGDFRADDVARIASGLNMPNGVALRGGDLYVAEVHRVIRFDDIESRLTSRPTPVVVNDSFPTDYHHGWKFIRFGPDGKLYVPVGAPCNACEREDERYASIMRMEPDG